MLNKLIPRLAPLRRTSTMSRLPPIKERTRLKELCRKKQLLCRRWCSIKLISQSRFRGPLEIQILLAQFLA